MIILERALGNTTVIICENPVDLVYSSWPSGHFSWRQAGDGQGLSAFFAAPRGQGYGP